MSHSPPKQFWVSKNVRGQYHLSYGRRGDAIQVIEKSAYDKAIESLKSIRDFASSANMHSSESIALHLGKCAGRADVTLHELGEL